jgi:large subunit ribosomal protein L6
MSRVGKKPIEIPAGVKVKKEGNRVIVEGTKGKLEREISPIITMEILDKQIIFKSPTESKNHRALQGLYRALIFNMVKGVTEGFKKYLQISGLGYRAEVKGGKLSMNLGFSHPVVIEIPAGIKVSVEKQTRICIEGIDKEMVGQFAASIREIKKPEPYKGKGILYEGERIRRKVGKAGAT